MAAVAKCTLSERHGGRQAAWLHFFFLLLFPSSLPLTRLVFKGFLLAEMSPKESAGRSFTSALMETRRFYIFFSLCCCCRCCFRPPPPPPRETCVPKTLQRRRVISYFSGVSISDCERTTFLSRVRKDGGDGREECFSVGAREDQNGNKIQNHKTWINIQSDEPLLKICLFLTPVACQRSEDEGLKRINWLEEKQKPGVDLLYFNSCFVLSKLHFEIVQKKNNRLLFSYPAVCI